MECWNIGKKKNGMLSLYCFKNFPFWLKKEAANSIEYAHSVSGISQIGYCRHRLKNL
jgi:hypothetical protein